MENTAKKLNVCYVCNVTHNNNNNTQAAPFTFFNVIIAWAKLRRNVLKVNEKNDTNDSNFAKQIIPI